MFNLIAYSIYLSIALITVLWVGKILYRNGRFFLLETFTHEVLADSVNRILYLGYCLVNSGCAFYHLNTCTTLVNYQQLLEFISSSCGQLYLIIGFMHLENLFLIQSLKPFLQHH
ncbi:MAG: hypothetical protein ACJ76F_05430 [Bacteroidia bacterium]